MMRKRSLPGITVASWLSIASVAGCARAPVVQSELPIRRVVVYRNGVAYFERSGHVEGDTLSFRMKQTEVGDFLATLAVMEQGGSSVRAAAFPLDMDRDNEGARPGGDDKPIRKDPEAQRTVVLSLDGRAHDLQIGYVAAAPVWRPSYRLVMRPGGQADLQAWGIVENLSGEDWSRVQLSLVAGAPLAFEARLGTPVIPERPVVTDQGEVIAAMPKGETSVEQDRDSDGAPDLASAPPPPGVAAAPAPAPPAEPEASGAARGRMAPATPSGSAGKRQAGPRGGEAPVERPAPSGPRNLRSLAAIAVQGGSTRYDIPDRVTVPDDSATMVILLAQRVRGESIFLFAPDPGVPDSSAHPFHVARFDNATGGVLERGPIAVFQQGSFVGQGLLDPLPAGATATVPFALERAIGVDEHQESDVQGARVGKIEGGALWIERDSVVKTLYAVENGGAEAAKILVRHPRRSGARLFEPPAGTEDNVGAGTALVPVTVAAHGKGKLVVDERSASGQWSDWFSAMAETAISAYLADPRSQADVVQELTALWPLRKQIVGKQDERGKAQLELSQLGAEAQEKRADLRAIEKNKAADVLRRSLTSRLAAIASRQDLLTAQNIQLGQGLSELQIRWREGVRAIHLVSAPRPP